MSQVSEIIVKWTPETSGRVSSIQIQSRIAGTQEWTEQAGSFDPKVGEFRFTSNAPATDVEVRVRYRMLDGIYSDWSTDHVLTAPAGVIIGEDVKNPDGTVWVPPAIDMTQVQTEVEAQVAAAKALIDADLAAVAIDVADARNEARVDLAGEASRASAAEGALNTSIIAAQTTADNAVTSINEKTTLLANADTALSNRATTLESQMAGTTESQLQTRISTEETTRANQDSALAGRATTLESQMAGTQGSALQTRISNEETTRTNADTTLGNRASALESQIAGSSGSGLLTRISTEETTRANADSALSNRTSTLESQLTGQVGSYVLSRIVNEETTRSNADSALASRATLLESTVGAASGSMNANPAFSVWLDANPLPSGWSWWIAPTSLTRVASPLNSGGYVARIVVGASSGGHFQTVSGLNPGDWCVIDVAASLVGGTWQGAGITMSGVQSFNFAALPDVAGVTSSTQSGMRRWSFLFQTDGSANLHAMTNWGGFGAETAKTLDWYRCSIRPATAGEIAAQKASVDLGTLTSRISTEETTRTNADSALANRASTLESQFGLGTDSSLYARLRTEETTRASETNSLASRTSTLETSSGNLSSRVSTTESAISGLNGKTAAYWQVQTVAGNGRAQMTVHADANGGGGVDIVGDVRITGSAGGATTIITGNGIFGYYANGNPAFKLGLI